jgi:hypothetical protein
VSTSYVEMPAWTWGEYSAGVLLPGRYPAVNIVGDMYDGVSKYEPVVNFAFKQFEAADPTAKLASVGMVNSDSGTFGALSLFPRSTLFKSCNIEQHVESWGTTLYRGYMVSYEFAYRKNTQSVWVSSGQSDVDIGWDVAMPMTGFNVRAFSPVNAGGEDDLYGQPLRHYGGKVVPPLLLPDNVAAGDKVRAMVKVMDYQEGGVSQTPSAQPVALNWNGRPRSSEANPQVIVNRYALHDQFNFTTLGLRLPI